MQLNTSTFPPDATLRQLHLERGDYIIASRFGDVAVRFLGTAWEILFRDDRGVAKQLMRTTDADAFRAARFVADFGAAPIERSRTRTLTGLQMVAV